MTSEMQNLIVQNHLVRYPFSQSSLENLIGVHPELARLAFAIANFVDIKIVYGVRTDEEQLKLFKLGKSSFDGVRKRSKHQLKEDGYGHALDILPLPSGVNMYEDSTENTIRWAQFNGFVFGLASMLNMKIKSGFKWRNNIMDSLKRNYSENTLKDGNHFQIEI